MAFTGNSSYAVAAYTAFAVEKQVAKKWHTIWTASHPLLEAMADPGTNFNQNFDLEGSMGMIISVNGDDLTNPASGVTDANELTADTVGITNGFSQAFYYIAHYRAHATYRASENFMASQGPRGNLYEGKVNQVLESFKKIWTSDASTTTVDSRTKIMGYRYALSTSNSPGGISQTTDAQWAAQTKTSAGTFGLNLIDDQIDKIAAEGRTPADLILAGNTSADNMFGKIRTAIGPVAERLVNINGKRAKYGLQSFVYINCPVVLDTQGVSGEINVLSTPSWYVYMPKKPTTLPMAPLDKTDAQIQTYTLFTSLGCGDPALNASILGIT